MKSNVVRFPITHEPSMGAPVPQSRAGASYLRRRLCAAGLTQEQAARLIGRDGRQVRRWLASPPPVLQLLAALEAMNDVIREAA
jgi:hypothetical protein